MNKHFLDNTAKYCSSPIHLTQNRSHSDKLKGVKHWIKKKKKAECFFYFLKQLEFKEFLVPLTIHTCSRCMRQSGQHSLDIFKDAEFSLFRVTLDAKMKRLQSKRFRIKTDASWTFIPGEWRSSMGEGLCGKTKTPKLFSTQSYFITAFILLSVVVLSTVLSLSDRGKKSYLRYTDDTSKNRPGGLKG